MSDGEYDIFGNLVGADGVVQAAPEPTVEHKPKPSKSGVGWRGGGGGDGAADASAAAPVSAPAPASAAAVANPFAPGIEVQIKEGGKKYRTAKVVSFDAGIGTIDVVYEDGEKECGVPTSLVRKPEGGGGGGGGGDSSAAAAAAPASSSWEPPAGAAPKAGGGGGSSAKDKKSSSNKARKLYELAKTMSDAELDAATAMLQALLSVRPKPEF